MQYKDDVSLDFCHLTLTVSIDQSHHGRTIWNDRASPPSKARLE